MDWRLNVTTLRFGVETTLKLAYDSSNGVRLDEPEIEVVLKSSWHETVIARLLRKGHTLVESALWLVQKTD